MNSIETSTAFVQRLFKEQYELDIHLEKMYGTDFFPQTHVKQENGEFDYVIRYNKSLEVLLKLYNAVLLNDNDTSQAIIEYVLFFSCLETDEYVKAEKHLNAFQTELAKLTIEHIDENEEQIATQVLFVLLHEAYHVVFRYKPEVRLKALSSEQDRLADIQAEWADISQTMTSNEIVSHPEILKRIRNLRSSMLSKNERDELEQILSRNMKWLEADDFEAILQRKEDAFLEELACDNYAWTYIMELMKSENASFETKLQLHNYMFAALNAMDFDHAFHSWYIPVKHNYIHYDGKKVIIRHKSFKSLVRHFLLIEDEKERRTDYLHLTDQIEKIFQETMMSMVKYHDELAVLYSDEERTVDSAWHDRLVNEMDEIIKKHFATNQKHESM